MLMIPVLSLPSLQKKAAGSPFCAASTITCVKVAASDHTSWHKVALTRSRQGHSSLTKLESHLQGNRLGF
jgi:hypothetical protein